MRPRPYVLGFVVAAAATLLAATTRADDDDPIELAEQQAEQSRRTINAQLEIAQSLVFKSDVRSGGDVSYARTRIDASAQGNITDSTTLAFGVVIEPTFYRFRDAPRLVPGTNDPVDDVYLVRFGPTLTMRVNESWSWFVGAHLRFAGESGADAADAFTISGFGGASHRANENFTYSIGLYVFTRMEDDPLVLPLIAFNWRIDERLRLSSRGTGLRLGYALNDAWEIAVSGQWELREYRLDEDRNDLPGGVFIEERVPVSGEIVWRPNGRVEFALEGGVIAYQEFETLTRSGRSVHTTRTDPAPFFEIRARIRF